KERSGGNKVSYSNPIAVEKNGGFRYSYGNMFYVDLLQPYLTDSSRSACFEDDTFQAVMEEAFKYEGFQYVFGGDNPNTSFDCSGLTRWVYREAGISLPRTAQEQYEATESISLSEAKPGDLVFFHSTYGTANEITHVGIIVRSEEHTSELSHVSISYAVFCLKKKQDTERAHHQSAGAPLRRVAPMSAPCAACLRPRSRLPPLPPLFPYTTLFRSFPEPHKSSTKQQNLFLYRKQNLAISFSSIPRMVLQMKSHMWGLLWVKTKCIMQAIRLVMPI